MHEITYHTFVHENVRDFMEGFRYDAHPMGMLLASVGALSTFYPESRNISDADNRHMQIVRLIAKMPTLGAWSFRHAQGKPYVYPDNDLSYTANFLAMLFKMSEQKFEADERLVKALDVLFILHADHEQNCSTNAVRSVGSSQVDPYSATAAGIAALYGPLHGGANEAVLRMLRRIGSVDKIPEFIEGVKNGKERLMGFGHRVYKNFDPRAKIIKKACDDVFEVTGVNPLLEIAMELEKIALEDEYFVQRKLYPNVDFYSGLIYEALQFPPEMFTVLFAIGRTPGWLAQWLELVQDKEQKIARPKQIYTGERDARLRARPPSAGRDRRPPAGLIRACHSPRARPVGSEPRFPATRVVRSRDERTTTGGGVRPRQRADPLGPAPRGRGRRSATRRPPGSWPPTTSTSWPGTTSRTRPRAGRPPRPRWPAPTRTGTATSRPTAPTSALSLARPDRRERRGAARPARGRRTRVRADQLVRRAVPAGAGALRLPGPVRRHRGVRGRGVRQAGPGDLRACSRAGSAGRWRAACSSTTPRPTSPPPRGPAWTRSGSPAPPLRPQLRARGPAGLRPPRGVAGALAPARPARPRAARRPPARPRTPPCRRGSRTAAWSRGCRPPRRRSARARRPAAR